MTSVASTSRKLFVNLPITDLPRARTFYEALGYRPSSIRMRLGL